jgi:hypothetical protein
MLKIGGIKVKNNYTRGAGNEGTVGSRDKKYLRIVQQCMNVTSVVSYVHIQ